MVEIVYKINPIYLKPCVALVFEGRMLVLLLLKYYFDTKGNGSFSLNYEPLITHLPF